jgi:hypothetical protein
MFLARGPGERLYFSLVYTTQSLGWNELLTDFALSDGLCLRQPLVYRHYYSLSQVHDDPGQVLNIHVNLTNNDEIS